MKKAFFRTVALILVAAISVSMIVISVSAVNDPTENRTTAKYQKISMESITGLGSNPEEISGNASSSAAQKQWYEYIMYSPQPVSSIRIDDNRRLVFYDPYDYGTSMIMKVTGEESEWSTANSISISYTTGNTLTDSSGYSTNTSTSTQVQEGKDESYSHSQGTSISTTKSWSNESSLSIENSTTLTLGTKIGIKAFGASTDITVEASDTFKVGSVDKSSSSSSFQNGSSNSTTEGWSTIANRVTTVTGSSFSTNTSWSTNSSKTVNRTFNAGYYNANGAPLPWKIVQYTVYMPLKYELQCKFDGEWYSTDSDFCIITTIQGACRAYMQNTQTYVEHWGTGEPVLWDDFWGRFFTEDKLIQAYQNKLYPNN